MVRDLGWDWTEGSRVGWEGPGEGSVFHLETGSHWRVWRRGVMGSDSQMVRGLLWRCVQNRLGKAQG